VKIGSDLINDAAEAKRDFEIEPGKQKREA
jgi:hypothetical protein